MINASVPKARISDGIRSDVIPPDKSAGIREKLNRRFDVPERGEGLPGELYADLTRTARSRVRVSRGTLFML